MYRRLSELVVRVTDLVEAEGRVLRAAVVQTAGKLGLSLALTIAGAALVLVGLVLMMAALWIGVAQMAGPAWASLATGIVTLGVGVLVLWLAGKAAK